MRSGRIADGRDEQDDVVADFQLVEIAGGHADVMLQGEGVLRSIDAEDAVCSIEDLKTGETASYRVSDNAANMIESIPTGAQVSFRYFAPQLEDELASLVSICTDDN